MRKHRSEAPACAARALARASVAALLAAILPAQVAWLDRSPNLGAREGHAVAFDLQRARIVLFGGYDSSLVYHADTWEWNGVDWARRLPANSPTARIGHALAYDLVRGRTVLFGGGTPSSILADTWEWDGANWLQRLPAQSPLARGGHALAFDLARNRTVLFGGSAGTSVSAETWEWDGVNWLQRSPAQSPPARYGHALAFDLVRNRTVLFGGRTLASTLADTWEWDGTNWLACLPAQIPPSRYGHALAYDLPRNRTVLFGGTPGSFYLADTWEWDGTNWVQRTPASSPPPRYRVAVAADPVRGRTVMFGGDNNGGLGILGDTWEWDGSNWNEVTPRAAPSARVSPALAYDRFASRTVLFGGSRDPSAAVCFADTWEWDGAHWLQRVPAAAPAARAYHALAFDSRRGRTVLFGGQANTSPSLADTWEWDGVNWALQTPATSPPARTLHAMTYDSGRGRVVLFGGWTGAFVGSALADTWEWDGSNWVLRTPSLSPPARDLHGLAYDPDRACSVMFGGVNNPYLTGQFADTWEWDGVNWSQRLATHAPLPRSGHALVHDEARGRTVLFGGVNAALTVQTLLSDTWEWDGTDWTQRTPAQRPPVQAFPRLAFDVARSCTVLVGIHQDTWEYGPADPGRYTPFGSGCAGSVGTPLLALGGGLLPYPGNVVTAQIAPLPANTAVSVAFGFSRTQWAANPVNMRVAQQFC
jgi:hypothetical protein